MREERRAGGALGLQPGQLVGDRMRAFEDAPRPAAELDRVALVPDRKTADGDTVHLLDTGRPLIPPRDVIARAGRHDFHLRMAGEALGHVTRVQLSASIDLS